MIIVLLEMEEAEKRREGQLELKKHFGEARGKQGECSVQGKKREFQEEVTQISKKYGNGILSAPLNDINQLTAIYGIF